jgi:hypothetical protein
MEDNHPDATDDLARAALLRIVPSGYRLIDEHDERFTGIREKFVRLALKHLGGKPSLVGFVDAGVDAQEAARAAAAWAAQNLTPSAIQRRVDPGVLVIAVNGAATAGPVPGAAVSSAVWTVAPDGRVETAGRRAVPRQGWSRTWSTASSAASRRPASARSTTSSAT